MTQIPQDQFPQVSGMRYLRFFRWLHQHRRPNWYLEVGTHMGRSLDIATCRSIAVDPNFLVNRGVIGTKPELHCLSQTSDDFFASGFAQRIGAVVDLAFLDGMHLFEFTLRDFMNCEKLMSPDGMIILHDVVPISYDAVQRVWDREKTREWTGDIWRLIPILRRYRPDLTVTVLDARPSGLALITGLDPNNTVLDQAYDQIVAENTDQALTPEVLKAAVDSLQIEPVADYIARHTAPQEVLNFALKIPTPRQETSHKWGEFHYATSLAEALQRMGHGARVDCREDWQTAAQPGEVEVLVRGKFPFEDSSDNLRLMWVQSHAEKVSADEMRGVAHSFLATQNLPKPAKGVSCSALLQCTDATRFPGPKGVKAPEHPVLFVGNCYPKRKSYGMVAWAQAAGLAELAVYGTGWGWVAPEWQRGGVIPNDQLGAYYRAAGVVLNDHHHSMRGAAAYVNNRVYDVLACGVPLICDPVAGLPDGFGEFIYICDGPEALADCVAQALAEDEAMRTRRREFAQHVREAHSFDARAREIVEKLQGLGQGG